MQAIHNFIGILRRGITPVALLCLGISLVGCLAIYNATFHLQHPFEFVGRQMVWLLLATLTLFLTSGMPADSLRRVLPWLAGIAYLLLWSVLHFGIRINGMQGWYAWNGIFLQPSEIGKPFFIISLALLMEHTAAERQNCRRGYLPLLGLLGAWTLPIALQPDFGALLIYAMAFALVYACGGGRLKFLVLTFVAGLPVAILTVLSIPYVRNRFLGFLHPQQYADSAGWHIIQFQRTLASGGFSGKSWGKGVWSQTYLPFGYSDSIFATIGESIGFIGLIPFVLVLILWTWYGYRRARAAANYFAALVIIGMVSILTSQAFIHLSVNLGMFPPTGITLPLISYGGSSLLATVLCVGIVESISRPTTTVMTEDQ